MLYLPFLQVVSLICTNLSAAADDGRSKKFLSLEDLARVPYASGFSQRKLARTLKVNPRTVNLCFQGKSKPSPENLVKLAKILNIDPLELSKLFMNLKK
ncbi:MAG: helix-turn-helix domain-containing protein [Thermotoga caldifontis]|uniref:helix-turn-helix domain-containing protein n=1 Tax=Thermotoga caldifontis TaxID=1508419 RepID=UPI003C7C6BF4